MEQVIVDKIKELLNGWCCDKLKDAGNQLLSSLGTDKEDESKKKFIEALEWSICSMEELDEFAHSEKGKSLFLNGENGEEKYNHFIKHVEEMKANGEQYCDCPACKKALDLLNMMK